MPKLSTKCDIFLSHSALHTSLANELAAACRASGLEVYSDTGVPVDGGWEDAVRDRLTESDALIVVLPLLGLSTWMMIEIGAAQALGKPIYVIAPDVPPQPMPAGLSRLRLYPPGRIGDVIQDIKSRGKAARRGVSNR
jgi:hypothetical protein